MGLSGCGDIAPLYAVKAGPYILYYPPVGAHGHVYHGFLVGDFLPFGGTEHLGAAFFRIAGDVGQVHVVVIVQACKESAEKGILLLDEPGKVTMPVYALALCLGEKRAVRRQELFLAAPVCHAAVQRGEERAYLLRGAMQFPVFGVWGETHFQCQHLFIGARSRQRQTGKFHTDGIVQQEALFARIGVGTPQRVPSDMRRHGIPDRLPLTETCRQVLER